VLLANQFALERLVSALDEAEPVITSMLERHLLEHDHAEVA
jgi:hypothetical protein